MKILYLSVNQDYFNNMHTNYQNSLAEMADVTFYGPGFSTNEELEEGLKSFWNRGKYDLVLCSFFLIQKSIELFPIKEIYYWHRDFISYYQISKAIYYVPAILKDFEMLDCCKVLLYEGDLFTFSKTMYDYYIRLLDDGAYLLAPGEEFLGKISNETFFAGVKRNVYYEDLVTRYRNRVISITVCAVTAGESSFSPLFSREYDVTVPGIMGRDYPSRTKVNALLQKSRLSVYDLYRDRGLGHNFNSKYPSPYSRPKRSMEKILVWREEYSRSLTCTKMAWADGGTPHSIVRKYFEIPVRKTILICENAFGLSDLGFVDGENMVLVEADQIVEKCQELLSNLSWMEQLATNGQKLVLKKHTVSHRIKNTLQAFGRIEKGDFGGSRWIEGKFCIL